MHRGMRSAGGERIFYPPSPRGAMGCRNKPRSQPRYRELEPTATAGKRAGSVFSFAIQRDDVNFFFLTAATAQGKGGTKHVKTTELLIAAEIIASRTTKEVHWACNPEIQIFTTLFFTNSNFKPPKKRRNADPDQKTALVHDALWCRAFNACSSSSSLA